MPVLEGNQEGCAGIRFGVFVRVTTDKHSESDARGYCAKRLAANPEETAGISTYITPFQGKGGSGLLCAAAGHTGRLFR